MVAQIVEHMSTPLVLWGWRPGDGRTPIPMPQQEFLGVAWANGLEKEQPVPKNQALVEIGI